MSKTIESDLFGLSGKVAIVTGAGGYIGSSLVTLLSQLGVSVLAVDLKFKENQFVNVGPGKVLKSETDISNYSAVQNAVRKCLESFGEINILANLAGMIKGGSILDLKSEDWDRIIDVDLGGYVNFAKEVARYMVREKIRGRIVNTSSVDGLYAEPGIVAYSVAKGGVAILTKCMAIELAPYDIRVNAIAPGWVDTPMGGGLLDAESRKKVNERIPLGYIAPPEEIARAIVFMISDLSSYMTGHIMIVDGGLTSDMSIRGLKY